MTERAVAPLAPEKVVELRDATGVIVRWFCTPEHLPALAAGWLIGEGRVDAPDDVGPLEVDPAGDVVRLTRPPGLLRPAGRPLPRGPRRSSDPDPLASPDTLRSWFGAMFAGGVLRERTGGVHTGALVGRGRLAGGGGLIAVREDVSRHCVVDKLIGSAALDGMSLAGATLLLTGRLSGAIVAKGARTGIAAMATMSIPTTMAAEIAAAAGITLIGRARSASPHSYAPGG